VCVSLHLLLLLLPLSLLLLRVHQLLQQQSQPLLQSQPKQEQPLSRQIQTV
jgi:hypothetical protein